MTLKTLGGCEEELLGVRLLLLFFIVLLGVLGFSKVGDVGCLSFTGLVGVSVVFTVPGVLVKSISN